MTGDPGEVSIVAVVHVLLNCAFVCAGASNEESRVVDRRLLIPFSKVLKWSSADDDDEDGSGYTSESDKDDKGDDGIVEIRL